MARKSDKRRSRPVAKRHYPRTARLNTLLQQIVADFLERVDDDRIGFITVTGVEVDADLNKAQVFVSTLADESSDDDTLEALEEYRKPMQKAIANRARIRKTPEVVFAFDPAVRAGARIESILSEIKTGQGTAATDDDTAAEDDAATKNDAVDLAAESNVAEPDHAESDERSEP